MIANLQVSSVDPVGVSTNNNKVLDFIANLKKQWDDIVSSVGKMSMKYCVKFLILCLDALIVFMESSFSSLPGADKKATVLGALSAVYDYVVIQSFPLWLKPFSPLIKSFVINTVCAITIDWIVNKYNSGVWNLPKSN